MDFMYDLEPFSKIQSQILMGEDFEVKLNASIFLVDLRKSNSCIVTGAIYPSNICEFKIYPVKSLC